MMINPEERNEARTFTLEDLDQGLTLRLKTDTRIQINKLSDESHLQRYLR